MNGRIGGCEVKFNGLTNTLNSLALEKRRWKQKTEQRLVHLYDMIQVKALSKLQTFEKNSNSSFLAIDTQLEMLGKKVEKLANLNKEVAQQNLEKENQALTREI